MTVKDLTCENYKTLQTDLLQNSHRNPYCPIYKKSYPWTENAIPYSFCLKSIKYISCMLFVPYLKVTGGRFVMK